MARLARTVALAWLSAVTPALAQEAAEEAPATESAEPKQEELDQMLAPLALYPDSLLSQVLMASTYPLEIVEADRWVKASPGLEGQALTEALEQKDWDPSVKSLVNFPDVLAALSEKLEWTRKIGDAFLADQAAVMDTIQKLRAKAKEAGNLESSDELEVTTEPAPAGSDQEIIVIESSDPDVIYVPAYDPTVVYGAWWYPGYPPPVYYYPPGYAGGPGLWFGIGFICGSAWGYAWGGCSWGHHEIDIDIDRNVNINADIDRGKYRESLGRDGQGTWKHDASHRKGVEYRDAGTAQRFGGASREQAIQSREAYRGRAEADRAELSRERATGRIDASGRVDTAGAADRSRDASARSGVADRAGSSGRAGAFTGTGGGRSAAQQHSTRGQVSRASAGRGVRGGRGR